MADPDRGRCPRPRQVAASQRLRVGTRAGEQARDPFGPGAAAGGRLIRRALQRRSDGLPAGMFGSGATPGMRGEGVKTRSPLCRTEPSARGVAPATVDAARSATGGQAVRPQEATAQADGRKVRCESPKARIVNRPPSSFSRSRTVTSGSARASENAIPAATPPDGAYGPLDKAALHPYAVLADRVSPVPYPASAVRTAGGAPGKDHLTDCTHGPRGDRQPFNRRDCASHPPLPWLDHPPRGCPVPRPEARNWGYSCPSGGRVRALQAILRARISPYRPQDAQNGRESGFPASTWQAPGCSDTQSARGPPTGE